jgi:pyruvate dehydrogenase (quinone)
MGNNRVADLVTKVLAEAGVRRIYGVPGDSLNGITDSIRERKDIEWIHVRHEDSSIRRRR